MAPGGTIGGMANSDYLVYVTNGGSGAVTTYCYLAGSADDAAAQAKAAFGVGAVVNHVQPL